MISSMISYEQYVALLSTLYPKSARSIPFEAHLSPLLICRETIALPQHLKNEAERIVHAFFSLRSLASRSVPLEDLPPPISDPGNTSALMSYDFHIDEKGRLRLIEINTNASMSLIVDALNTAHNIKNPFCDDFRAEIVNVFLEEFASSVAAKNQEQLPKTAAIVDEQPEAQRLYLEFVLYKELFEKAGISTRICDPKDLIFESDRLHFLNDRSKSIDIVYNRHTDFYLQSPEVQALHLAMEKNAACITPHPHEYRLLADKERLLELSQPQILNQMELTDDVRQAIEETLIQTRSVKDFSSSEDLWNNRKLWFFKPKRSFGGKATYRGTSISRTTFAHVWSGDYLAQEFVPAPEVKLKSGEKMKFDLRFFAYRDRIQLACARIYQGQMTNTQTPGGGIAAINWI